MTLEIARRFVGGRWKTDAENEGENGGSLAVKVVRVPIAFDTPDINADGAGGGGIDLYTPAEGEALLPNLSYVSVPVTAWDDANTAWNLTFSDLAGAFGSGTLAVTDPAGPDGHTVQAVSDLSVFAVVQAIFPDATPLRLIVDDGSGSAPVATEGAGEFVLIVVEAS